MTCAVNIIAVTDIPDSKYTNHLKTFIHIDKTLILGTPFLLKYYSVYDIER
jgi:hypothetical protein